MFVFEVLLPLIFIVAVGFLSTKKGFFSQQFVAEVSKFVLYVSLPAVIISSLSSIELGQVIHVNFMLVYAIAGLSAMTVAILVSKGLLKSTWTESFINGLGSGMPNSAFVGFPVVLSLYDGQFIEAFLMCVLIENLVFIPLSLISLEFAQGRSSSIGEQLKVVAGRISRNPIILAISFALVVNITGIRLPEFVADGVSIFAKTSVALALFAIGGALGQSLKFEQFRRIAFVTSMKLVFFPLIVVALLMTLPVEGDLKYVLLIFAASPMLSIYPILGGLYQQQRFCLNTLIITTVASGLSLSVVIAITTSS
ncbi:AEC family transporter [Vibrio sp. D420a]|uniref:AEC family transporter n=1 Tax=Vibrio sp. D420a TaxID=2836895 RepID=UPI00255310BC|nr:AEC family transporter [Vibrio sp. D420a]MDK9761341.1 AEC family transporter [Vibrio sp. D420a]